MVVDDGGRRAAQGFHYQYLRTLESLLNVVNDSSVGAVRIEGGPDGLEQVDFDVVGFDGVRHVAAQVKSRRTGGDFSVAEVLRILMDLVEHGEAGEYQLLTNALPGPGAQRLAAAVRDAEDPIALGEFVLPLIENAPKQRQRFLSLSEVQKQRLCRSRLFFDSRSDDDLRIELRDRIRVYRNRVRDGLGDQAAGLLLRSLVAEVLERAADPDRASFTTEQFRTALLRSSEELHRVLGVRDFGIITGFPPPVPDIHRNEYTTRLETVFEDASGPAPRQAVLVGLSGLGKSSLAAAYLADHADAYDLVMWIDAENEVTLLESFHDILNAVHDTAPNPLAGGDLRRACATVHTELSRLPGRWLMVFDNAQDATIRRMCIPTVGRGDVIITSVDSASRYDRAEVIEVTAMRPDEALDLLRRRLANPDNDWTPEIERSLHEVARDLEYWPLALELAAGYILTCEIPLVDIDHYRADLLATSLDDELSLPTGYPRTLVAVIASAVQRLNEDPGNQTRRLALSMVAVAAYLAPHRLPIQLLAACSVLDPQDCIDENHKGILIPDPDLHSTLEAVRELRRRSLIRSDEPIPPVTDHSTPTLQSSIQVNEIVQSVIRSLPQSPENDVWLQGISFHIDRWLFTARSTAHFAGAALLAGHAAVLLDHLRARDLQEKWIATLYGNVAAILRDKGDLKQADSLWRHETDMLQSATSGIGRGLLAQTNLCLIEIFHRDPSSSSLTLRDVTARLGHVYATAQRMASESPEGATKLAAVAISILFDTNTAEIRHSELTEVYSLFVDLKARLEPLLGPTAFSRWTDQLHRASLIVGRYPREAEQICREFLTMVFDGGMEVQARRLLLEALVYQDKWTEAKDELTYIKELFGSESILHDLLSDLINNLGLKCAGTVLFDSDDEAATLLASILDWDVVPLIESKLRPGIQARLRLLCAIQDYQEGRRNEASEVLSTLQPQSLSDGHPNEVVGWTLLLAKTQAAVRS